MHYCDDTIGAQKSDDINMFHCRNIELQRTSLPRICKAPVPLLLWVAEFTWMSNEEQSPELTTRDSHGAKC